MLVSFGYIGLFAVAAVAFTLVMVLMPVMLRMLGIAPRKPNPVKANTYECGNETIGKSWVQYNFRYYFFALLFVALDVLVIFIYPWAVDLRKLGVPAFIAIVVFIFIVLVGYFYAWKKKALEWK